MFGIDTFAQLGASIAMANRQEQTQESINQRNLAQQERINQENWLHARQMFGWENLEYNRRTRDERAYNEERLAEQRDYDSYVNQKNRLVEAGYNPNALLGQFSGGSSPIQGSGIGSTSGTVPQSEAAHQVAPQAQNWIATSLNGLGDSIFRFQQLDRNDLENKLLENNISKIQAETEFITGAKTTNMNASTRNMNSRTTAQKYATQRQKLVDSMKNSDSWNHEANGEFNKFLREDNQFQSRLRLDIKNGDLRRYQILEQLSLQKSQFRFVKEKFKKDEEFRKLVFDQNQSKIDQDFNKWSQEFQEKLTQQEIQNEIAFQKLENERDNIQFKRDAMEYAAYASISNLFNRAIERGEFGNPKSFGEWKESNSKGSKKTGKDNWKPKKIL